MSSILPDTNAPSLIDIARESGSPFGTIFADYLAAFAERNRKVLIAAFGPDSRITVQDRRVDKTLDFTPAEFFDRLFQEVGDASFTIDNTTAKFNDGYLFVDGIWADQHGTPLLRATDLFAALSDGHIASLNVVWTRCSTPVD